MTTEEAFQRVLARCEPLETVTRERIFPDHADNLMIVMNKEWKNQEIPVTKEEYDALLLCSAYDIGSIPIIFPREYHVTIGFCIEMRD